MEEKTTLSRSFSRRNFLKTALVAGSALSVLPEDAEAGETAATGSSEQVVTTTCLGCNARCGVRVHVSDNNTKLHRVSGNPYHPYCMAGEPLPYAAASSEALRTQAPVCSKAHEAFNQMYDPYRILAPLKRSGPRGSGRFAPVSWEQLIREVADGGELFASIGEKETVPGLRSLLSDELIDPERPELGSVRNRFMFIGGRDQAGYQHFSNRFVKDAFGSNNRIGHTDICGLGFRMGNYALTEGKDVELKADPMSCTYMLIFGANVYEALQPGINHYGALLADRHAKGELRFVVIDPRATSASHHADDWLPVRPGQDGALALAMIRILIEENLFNRGYLEAYNAELAARVGNSGYTNACHLVIVDPEGPRQGSFLRWSDITGRKPEKTENAEDLPVVLLKDGKTFAPISGLDPAELSVQTTCRLHDGTTVTVKSAFTILREEACATSLDAYAEICGIERAKIEQVTRDFAAHGTTAAVCQYHGAGNYVGGTQASYAVALLSVLVGSINRKGGYMHGGGAAAPWNRGLYDLTGFPGRRKPSGVKISREGAVYETSGEYRMKQAKGSPYPAGRPWFSFTRGGLCTEALNGIDQQYPYGCGVLFTFFFNPVYSIPGGSHYIETFRDHRKVPLHVSIDVCVNESNLYADYIVPDLTWLEGKYAFMGPHAPALKFSTIRVPAMRPLTRKTGDGRAFSMETFLIDLAEYLGLPGFGEKAIPDRDGKMHPLHTPEDFYLRGLANLASNAGVAPAAPDEVRTVEAAYPLAAFRDRIPLPEWQKVCTVLARGGVFTHRYEDLFSNGAHRFGIPRLAIYNEKLAQARNSITGKRFRGTAALAPATDASGRNIAEEDAAYPFACVTYKCNVHAQSRSNNHRFAMELFPENRLHVHEKDADSLSLRENDRVRVRSRSCPDGIEVAVHRTRLIRQGCVALSFHYGHTQMGAGTLQVENGASVFLGGASIMQGSTVVADPRRGGGASFNALGRLDTSLGNTPLVDPCGGIPDFSSTRVRIEKI